MSQWRTCVICGYFFQDVLSSAASKNETVCEDCLAPPSEPEDDAEDEAASSSDTKVDPPADPIAEEDESFGFRTTGKNKSIWDKLRKKE